MDGRFRQYRIALIEGQPFICHYAPSTNWMIRHVGMRDSAKQRAGQVAAMAEFDAGFALRHQTALRVIDQRIGLPYLCIDCAEMPNGELLIFEVNNAMTVHAMDPEAMQMVFTAFRAMLERSRA